MDTFDKFDEHVENMWFSGGEPLNKELAIAGLGLTGEAGETAEKLKKRLRGDMAKATPQDLIAHNAGVALELGDVLFYVTKLAHLYGFTLGDVARGNKNKLESRKSRNMQRGDGDDR